jgi:DNA-binding NtrC family response regulator
VLVAEANASLLDSLKRSLAVLVSVANVDTCADFASARRDLLAKPYDLLVTNLRLEAYNGLHLVYLAQSRGPLPRAIVYTDRVELPLAREVQKSGAFYEVTTRLPSALPQYLGATLPPQDRRTLSTADRRRLFRGGRRSADLAALSV